MLAARAGAELGADIVKTSYTGDPRTFEKLVAVCPVPVVVAGGPRKGTTRDLLEMVKEAVDCGAAGVALGRNVWQSSDPARTTRALADIIHRGRSRTSWKDKRYPRRTTKGHEEKLKEK